MLPVLTHAASSDSFWLPLTRALRITCIQSMKRIQAQLKSDMPQSGNDHKAGIVYALYYIILSLVQQDMLTLP
jgi:hypothetical protein